MLFSKELCGFSVGDYVISKLADLGTGRVWKEIKHRLPKDDKALETQLYDAIEKSIICYSNVSYNSQIKYGNTKRACIKILPTKYV